MALGSALGGDEGKFDGDVLGTLEGESLGAMLLLGEELGAGLLLGAVLGICVGHVLTNPNGDGVSSKFLHTPTLETPTGSVPSIMTLTIFTYGILITTFVTFPAPSLGDTTIDSTDPDSVVTSNTTLSTTLTRPNSTTSVITGLNVKFRLPVALACGISLLSVMFWTTSTF